MSEREPQPDDDTSGGKDGEPDVPQTPFDDDREDPDTVDDDEKD